MKFSSGIERYEVIHQIMMRFFKVKHPELVFVASIVRYILVIFQLSLHFEAAEFLFVSDEIYVGSMHGIAPWGKSNERPKKNIIAIESWKIRCS
jgi:hypothetical protein